MSTDWNGTAVRRVKVRAVVEFDAFILDYPGDHSSESRIPIGRGAANELADAIAYHAGRGWDSESCDDVLIGVAEIGAHDAVTVEHLEISESGGPCTPELVSAVCQSMQAGY